MRRSLAIAMVLAVIGCASEESDRPSREDCMAARAHGAKLHAAEAGKGLPAEELAKHEANLVESGGEQAIAACLAKSRREVSCMLEAGSVADLAGCAERR